MTPMQFLKLATFILLSISMVNTYAKDYYVKNNGNDSANGTSDATAWKTLNKVNQFSFNVGDDIYFLAGNTWSNNLTVDWNGTDINRTVIGSYYMNNGTETIGVPYGMSKPTFKGTYPAIFNGANPVFESANAIPSGLYGGLIAVFANYVTVKNMRLTDSAGYSAVLEKTYHHAIFEDNEFIGSANANLQFKKNSHDNIMRRNKSSLCGLLKRDSPQLGTHPACNSAVGSWNNLFEDNYITEVYGEGLSSWGAYSRNNIFKNNILSAIYSVGIYLSATKDNIVENNIIIGDPSGIFDREGPNTGYPGPAISMISERALDNANNIIRNNLIAGTQMCFEAGIWPKGLEAGKKVSGKFIGNTCVGVETAVIVWNDAIDTTGLEIANNIFFDYDRECSSASSGNLNFHNNAWGDGIPTDVDCRGAGDVTGNPNLNTTSNFRLFSPTNMPTAKDFEPLPGSNTENSGAPMTSTIIALADFPMSTHLTTAVKVEQLTIDYLYNNKSEFNPDIGALEVGSSAQLSPPQSANEVMVPFYMNVGVSKNPFTLSKPYTAEAYRDMTKTEGIYCTSVNSSISNTIDDIVFQEYCGTNTEIAWIIPIANGEYDVALLFNEQYWGDETGTCIGGERRFDILIEEVLDKDEFDICEISRAPNTAVRYTKRSLIVTDGKLNIQLIRGSTGLDTKPEIAGIEIIPSAPKIKPPKPKGLTLQIKLSSNI